MAEQRPDRTLGEPHDAFWAWTAKGELRLQRCRRCSHVYFPPRPFCPRCVSREVDVFTASGRATLYSYVINRTPRPDMGSDPYAIAVVELAEGPRLMTNIVNCPQTPEALLLDMELKIHFRQESEEITLPLFEPAGRLDA